MVSSLVWLLVSHTGLLKKVNINETSSQLALMVKVDTDEFTLRNLELQSIRLKLYKETYKTRRIVIPNGLGISVRLQNWIGVDNTVLQVGLFLLRRVSILLLGLDCSEDGKVGDDLFGVLGLSGTGLASDQHGLILGVVHHLLVGTVGSSEEVRRHL